METSKLIGLRVFHKNTNSIGIIEQIRDGVVTVNYHGMISRHAFPAAFSNFLEIEDEEIQNELLQEGMDSSFEDFQKYYTSAINTEIDFLKSTGGKKYRIVDGERLTSRNDEYLYAFDTDSDFHFPDGTAVKLWFPDKIINGYIVSCEDFTLVIRTTEYIGEFVDSVEFTSEQWQLLEALLERLSEMNPDSNALAYQIACSGRKHISSWNGIKCGQNYAFNRGTTEEITFIWGPPGTGKTDTLANIALEHINKGNRVLMLSYSNVSVDGALLRVAGRADLPEGTVIRYGFPRSKEILESKYLSSYQYVLSKNPEKETEYKTLVERKKKLKKKDPERVEINKQLNKIREYFLNLEKELIHKSAFVATTASKATVDKAIYLQNFDVVIFDEASMAYIPQIVFAAGLAKKHFICLGDFCQLPAIVQNKYDEKLTVDIFDHVGITTSVNNDKMHDWLVMLDTQFRMHQDIADFVSGKMYGGRLKTSEKISGLREEIANCHPCAGFPMALIDLSGMYSVCTKTKDGSRINILSALMSLRLAEKNISMYEVGIITPYSAQSRLLLSMNRDIQEYDKRWNNVTCATVHQFQGSEKPIIIYDAVDCFRMPYPGALLTSMKNDSANRLFNVAITRAKGKFVLVGNYDYLKRKKISPNLLFTKAAKQMSLDKNMLFGDSLLYEMMPTGKEEPIVFISDRESSWEKFIEDIRMSKTMIAIDVPDVIDENDSFIEELVCAIKERKESGVDICIRCSEDIDLPEELKEYITHFEYVTNPVTIIDKQIIWFGQPLYAADFITEGEILNTEYFPCMRFFGKHTARAIQAFLEM